MRSKAKYRGFRRKRVTRKPISWFKTPIFVIPTAIKKILPRAPMPLNFETAAGCAVDEANGIIIYMPRMLPLVRPEDVEYQYTILHGKKRHGLGCLGLGTVIEENGEKSRLMTIDLGTANALASVDSLKMKLQIDDDYFEFLVGLAGGLVKAFLGETGGRLPIRYLALGDQALLEQNGVVAPPSFPTLPNGLLILAEAILPARPLVTNHP